MDTYYIIETCLGEIEIDTDKVNLVKSHSEGEHCAWDNEDTKRIKQSLSPLGRMGIERGDVVTVKRGTRANKSIREMFYD